jgi:hypothetical protein
MKTPLQVTMELMFPEGLKVTIGTERQRFSKLNSHFYKSRSAGAKKKNSIPAAKSCAAKNKIVNSGNLEESPKVTKPYTQLCYCIEIKVPFLFYFLFFLIFFL